MSPYKQYKYMLFFVIFNVKVSGILVRFRIICWIYMKNQDKLRVLQKLWRIWIELKYLAVGNFFIIKLRGENTYWFPTKLHFHFPERAAQYLFHNSCNNFQFVVNIQNYSLNMQNFYLLHYGIVILYIHIQNEN